jgi:hypothetical protein
VRKSKQTATAKKKPPPQLRFYELANAAMEALFASPIVREALDDLHQAHRETWLRDVQDQWTTQRDLKALLSLLEAGSVPDDVRVALQTWLEAELTGQKRDFAAVLTKRGGQQSRPSVQVTTRAQQNWIRMAINAAANAGHTGEDRFIWAERLLDCTGFRHPNWNRRSAAPGSVARINSIKGIYHALKGTALPRELRLIARIYAVALPRGPHDPFNGCDDDTTDFVFDEVTETFREPTTSEELDFSFGLLLWGWKGEKPRSWAALAQTEVDYSDLMLTAARDLENLSRRIAPPGRTLVKST